jgi:hypothetical protein
MTIADLKLGQTLQSTDLTHPFVGRIVGLDFVGEKGKPCALLKAADGVVVKVTNSELKNWLVLKAER